MNSITIIDNVILWNTNNKKWLLDYSEISNVYLTNKHPYTDKKIDIDVIKKIGAIIQKIAGQWWLKQLNCYKKYTPIPLDILRGLKTSARKLGSGKYAMVYLYNGYAVKVVHHKAFKDLPVIDASYEANILKILKTEILYKMYSPNIINSYQYTADTKTDYIILEKVTKTFWDYLQEEPDPNVIKSIIIQVLFTLVILQEKFPGFRHNDLKTDNILLDFSPRKQVIQLYYGEYNWIIPTTAPLVKIADFDYANIPNVADNCKVHTKWSKSFGCSPQPSKIYDMHLFLNSIYSCRDYLTPQLRKWLQSQLPRDTRGTENVGAKYGRLINPHDWNDLFNTPLGILKSNFFKEFVGTTKLPRWGLVPVS